MKVFIQPSCRSCSNSSVTDFFVALSCENPCLPPGLPLLRDEQTEGAVEAPGVTLGKCTDACGFAAVTPLRGEAKSLLDNGKVRLAGE